MSVAASRDHASSGGHSAMAALPNSAVSGHHSHHSRDLNAAEMEETMSTAKAATSQAAPSAAGSNGNHSTFPQPEIPPPPQSVASFAAPSVVPADSVSQIGSRTSKSASRVSTRLRLSREKTGSHHSRGSNARSQASSARLTAANLHAHDAEPQVVLDRTGQSEHPSQARTEPTARSSPKERGEVAEEVSDEQEVIQETQSTVPSKASTVKVSQKNIDITDETTSRTTPSKPPTEGPASKFGDAATSHIGSKAATATPSHFNARASNAESSHSKSHVSKSPPSHVGSKAATAILFHAESKAQSVEHSRSTLASDQANPQSNSRAETTVSVRSHSKAPSEALPRADSASPRSTVTYSQKEIQATSGSSHLARSVASQEPSMRTSGSDPHLSRMTGNTYVVEVEREDEQVTGQGYRIQRSTF